MLSGMLPLHDHQDPPVALPVVTEPVETSPATRVQPATADVSWHLSPGYAAHLHVYELAMLPPHERGEPAPSMSGSSTESVTRYQSGPRVLPARNEIR